MTDIFISYSRQNQPFVRKLVSQLEAAEKAVWVDWEAIPWTADWWREIREGIEKSNSVVFVMSHASLASVVCMLELDYAIQNNKRIIPVVYEKSDQESSLETLLSTRLDDIALRMLDGRDLAAVARNNWRFIAQHNWMFCDDETQFEQFITNLLTAMDTDIEYVRTHTRLLTRAREWDNQKRNASFLLFGDDIRSGETWLSSAGKKNPQPGQLHIEYIFASRQRANRQQRRLLTGVSVALVVAVVLALTSLVLWQQASFQRDRANLQAQISESGRVALRGVLALGEDRLDEALLLNVAAIQVYNSYEARSGLLTSLQASPLLVKFSHEPTTGVRSIAYRSDGQQYATAEADGTIRLWDAATHQSQGDPLQWMDGEQPLAIWDLAYSPDGTHLAASAEDGSISLWDTARHVLVGDPLMPDSEDAGAAYSIAYSPDGSLLAGGYGDGLVRLWDAATGELLQELENHTDSVYKVTFSPDGRLLASGGGDSLITLWSLEVTDSPADMAASAEVYWDLIGHLNWVFGLAFSPDGTRLASASADGTVQLWDTVSGDTLGQAFSEHRGWVRSVAFSPDGSLLASGGEDHTIILRDGQTGQRLNDVLPLTGHSGTIFSIVFSPDSQAMLSGDEDGNLLLWNVIQRQPLKQHFGDQSGDLYRIRYSPDGTHLLTVGKTGGAMLWDVTTGQSLFDAFDPQTEIICAAFSPDGQLLAYGDIAGTITVRKVTDGSTQSTITAHTGVVRDLVFNGNDRLISTGDDGTIKTWDVTTGESAGEPLTTARSDPLNPIWALALSPDRKLLATGDNQGNLLVWDMDQDTLKTRFPVSQKNITALAFSPNGSLLASSSRDKTILLWDVVSGTLKGQPLLGHNDWVLDVAFSSDGALLASGSRDQSIILWDVPTQQLIGTPLAGVGNWVWSVAFNPDHLTLASASRGGSIDLWSIGLADWVNRACAIVNRNFTPVEREQFLSAEYNTAGCVSD